MIRSALRLWPAQLTQIYIRLTKAMLVITHKIGVLVVKAPKILPKFWSISSWEFSSRYLFPSRFFVMDSPSWIKWFTISLLKIADQPHSFYLGHLTWNPMHSFLSCTLQKIGLLRIGYTSFGAVHWTQPNILLNGRSKYQMHPCLLPLSDKEGNSSTELHLRWEGKWI